MWVCCIGSSELMSDLFSMCRNTTGVSEEQIREINQTFNYFDRNKSGQLEYHEFKACLRSLGCDLAVVEEGQTDPEFEAILDRVDPNRLVYLTRKRVQIEPISW